MLSIRTIPRSLSSEWPVQLWRPKLTHGDPYLRYQYRHRRVQYWSLINILSQCNIYWSLLLCWPLQNDVVKSEVAGAYVTRTICVMVLLNFWCIWFAIIDFTRERIWLWVCHLNYFCIIIILRCSFTIKFNILFEVIIWWEKGRDLTKSNDKSPYTNRNVISNVSSIILSLNFVL